MLGSANESENGVSQSGGHFPGGCKVVEGLLGLKVLYVVGRGSLTMDGCLGGLIKGNSNDL